MSVYKLNGLRGTCSQVYGVLQMTIYEFFDENDKLVITAIADSLEEAKKNVIIPWFRVETPMENRIQKIQQYLKDRSAEKHIQKCLATYDYVIEYIYDEILTPEEMDEFKAMVGNPTCDCSDDDIALYRKRIEDSLLENLPWRLKERRISAQN